MQALKIAYIKHEVSNTIADKTMDDSIHCYLGDASNMEIQLDQYDDYFFFNPFSYQLSVTVFQHIIDSLKRRPRHVKIFYAEPICHRFLLESGYFILESTVGDSFGGITYTANVYKSIYPVTVHEE